jgi:hypothetical protein
MLQSFSSQASVAEIHSCQGYTQWETVAKDIQRGIVLEKKTNDKETMVSKSYFRLVRSTLVIFLEVEAGKKRDF